MLFADNSRTLLHGLTILLHVFYDVDDYIAFRLPEEYWLHLWDSRSGALFHQFYIGSTSVSVQFRQDARLRKYCLLQRGDFCNAELMLRFFHTRSDLLASVTVPLQTFDNLHDARAAEYSYIHSLKPQLNAPWIINLNATSTTRFTQLYTVKSTYGSPGKKLWLKVRRKLRALGLLRLYENTVLEPVDNWVLL